MLRCRCHTFAAELRCRCQCPARLNVDTCCRCCAAAANAQLCRRSAAKSSASAAALPLPTPLHCRRCAANATALRRCAAAALRCHQFSHVCTTADVLLPLRCEYMCKLAFFQNPLTGHVDQFLLSPIFWDTHGGSGCRTRTNTEQIYRMPSVVPPTRTINPAEQFSHFDPSRCDRGHGGCGHGLCML